MPVRTWGDFEIDFDQVLGRGGMGAVYKGRQISLDRPAAIKVLKRDLTQSPEFVRRFHREAALLARLVDSHVVQIFGAGEAEGEHYYAMEFVEGQDFSAGLKAGSKYSTEEVLQVAHSVGLALQAAWKHRIIHRDIKPSNIIRTKEGEIKVMDFGLARKSESSDLTEPAVIMGTAKYMSPEQATGGACDIRSDLYSLGVVLYELAAGKAPFVGETTASMMYQHVHQKPVSPRELHPGLPAEVEEIILRLMAKKPEQRYGSPEALISAVQGARDGVSADERATLYNETLRIETSRAEAPIGQRPVAPRSSGSVPLVLTLLAAALLLGVAGYYVFEAVSSGPAPIEPPRREVASTGPVVLEKPLPPIAPPPTPPSTPPSNPPTVPAAPPAWEEPRRKGMEAFGKMEWVAAWSLLEEARSKGATDVDERIRQAHAAELIAKGDEESNEQRALESYEGAKKYLPDDDTLKRKIARTTFSRWSRSAEGHEGGDWAQAAVDWGRALAAVADETLKPEVEARRLFCDRFARAVQARTNGDWEKALGLFKELAREPRAFAAKIESEIKEADAQVVRAAELADKKLREEFERLTALARTAQQRAEWRKAKECLDLAGNARFAALPKDEIRKIAPEISVALAAPAGMAYVPGGKFRMGGGGHEVEGPEGEAETAPFYMDDHELTVAEYREFLKDLESSGGHHPACALQEPAGKSHVPDGWASQKAEASVVSVDWWDAASYAAWARKRLPREIEWERAASFDPAGKRAYPWGDRYQKDGGRSYLGIEGLGSGVIEWTADWFQKYPWSAASHPEFGERFKVLRGGVLLVENAERDARVTHRQWNLPSKRSINIGIRCVRDPADK